MKKSQPKEYGNRYPKVAILAEMVGFAVCCGFALHTAWPRLVRSALLPENSVPHCFLYGKTLSGSKPTCLTHQKNNHPNGWLFFWRRWGDSNPRAGSSPTIRFRVLWINGCLAIFEGSFGILRIRRKCLMLKAF